MKRKKAYEAPVVRREATTTTEENFTVRIFRRDLLHLLGDKVPENAMELKVTVAVPEWLGREVASGLIDAEIEDDEKSLHVEVTWKKVSRIRRK